MNKHRGEMRRCMAAVKHGKSFIFLLLFFLPFFGCAMRTPAVLREDTAPFSYGASAEKCIEAARIDGVFKATAYIEMNSIGKRYPLRVALMLKLPSLMRIETIPPIGPPDFFLSMTHDTFKVFMPAKQKFYQGRSSREKLAHFLPIRLSPEDMVRILMGIPPGTNGENLTFREGAAGGRCTDEKCSVDVFSSDNKKIMTLQFNGGANRPGGMDIFDLSGESLYTVSYDEYFKVGDNIDIPQRITIISRETNSTITIRYSDMELSRQIDETFFDLPLPPGMKAIILDTEGGSWEEN